MKLVLAISLFTSSTLWAEDPSVLSLDPGSGTPGGAVILNLNLASPADSLPAGLQWTLSYASRDVVSVSMEAGPALLSAGKTLTCNTVNGSSKCLAVGLNANAIGNGVVAVVTAMLSAEVGISLIPLSLGNTLGVSADGFPESVQAAGGAIAVQSNPLPSITSLSPSRVTAGGASFTLSVSGSGFVPGSVVYWNGSARPTSFVSSAQLNAAISASDIGLVNTALISVSSPAPGGGNSTSLLFSITESSGPVPAGPSPGAVGPASGSGASVTMTFTFNDPRGWWDLDVVNILINSALDGRQSCYLAYSAPLNVLYLVNDTGTMLLPGLMLNGAGSRGNAQCTVNGANSAVTASGNMLTITLDLSFSASFAGNKVIYLAARDLNGGNSGWQALGTWGVPGFSTFPTAAGVSPARGSGASQTFTFTFGDEKGYQDLGVVNILINDALDGSRACYLAYSRPLGTVYLMNDTGTSLLPPLALNGAGTVANNQCSVSAAGSIVIGGGNTLTVTFALSFSASFAGNRVIFMAARDNGDFHSSGWQAMGTWTVQ